MAMHGTADSRLAQLHKFGQSPWFDYISRDLVARGGLRRMVERDALGGVTSNPSIFEKAIGSGKAYDDQILALGRQGLNAAQIFDSLAVEDVRAACDVLASVYLASGGQDGFVSIEVSPAYAYDTEKTISEARRLFTAVDRPNVMIKIPGTKEGVPAILESLRQGLNINITLLFSLSQYEAVAEAYLDALEYRLQKDLTIRATTSVASFFVSRVDTLVDSLLDQRLEVAADESERRRLEGLKGVAGVANSKLVYERFRTYLHSREWQLIAASGAKIQRLLWASTGTKNPAYPDTLYVDELIGEHTVNTLTEGTWKAFNDHGTLARTVDRHLEDAHRALRELSQLGLDMERVGAQLQTDGVHLFSKSFGSVIDNVEQKRANLLALEVG
jgi:transaldolase